MEGFQHPNIRKCVLDVTNGDDIERTVQTILAETGKIDILVNNAGALAISWSSFVEFMTWLNLVSRSRS